MEYILHEINSRNLGEVLKPHATDLKIVKKVHMIQTMLNFRTSLDRMEKRRI